jgi:hypothetical protein
LPRRRSPSPPTAVAATSGRHRARDPRGAADRGGCRGDHGVSPRRPPRTISIRDADGGDHDTVAIRPAGRRDRRQLLAAGQRRNHSGRVHGIPFDSADHGCSRLVAEPGGNPQSDGDHRADRHTTAQRRRIAGPGVHVADGHDASAMLGIHPALQQPPRTMKFAVIAPVAAGVTADPTWIAAFARHVKHAVSSRSSRSNTRC